MHDTLTSSAQPREADTALLACSHFTDGNVFSNLRHRYLPRVTHGLSVGTRDPTLGWRLLKSPLLAPSLRSLCPLPLLQGGQDASSALLEGAEMGRRWNCPARDPVRGLEPEHPRSLSSRPLCAGLTRLSGRPSRKAQPSRDGAIHPTDREWEPGPREVLAQGQAAGHDNDLRD